MQLTYAQYAPNQGVLSILINGDKFGDFNAEFSRSMDDVSPNDMVFILFDLSLSPIVFDLNDSIICFARLSKWKDQIKAVAYVVGSDLQFGIARQQLALRFFNGIETSVHRSYIEAEQWINEHKTNRNTKSDFS